MYNIQIISHLTVILTWLPTCMKGQTVGITWNGMMVFNNSLVTLSVVLQRATIAPGPLYPLVCQGIAGGQWYEPNGVLHPAALPITTPGGYGQLHGSLYRGTPYVFPPGVQCCTNTTITLCVGMYTDMILADSLGISTAAPINYALSVAATYGPNITGAVHFQLLTPTNIGPPVFQLTCTSTSSPPTTVQWSYNGNPVNGGNYISSQIVTDGPTSTYNNTLTVTGISTGMYACNVITTCSPVCGSTGFTLNPRSTTSSLTVQSPPGPPSNITAIQTGPTSVNASWTAPTSGGPVNRYDIYYVANGVPNTIHGSTISTSYVLTNLKFGVQYNVSVIAVGVHLPGPSQSAVVYPGPPTDVNAVQSDATSISVSWSAPIYPVTRYDIYYVANGIRSTRGGSTTSTSYVLNNLQAGVKYNISVISIVGYLASQPAVITDVSSRLICYTTLPCIFWNISSLSLASRTPGQCCVGGGGLSYRTVSGAVCTSCVVYGFFQDSTSTTPITTMYVKEGLQLNVYFGYVSGTLTTGNHRVYFNVTNSPRYVKTVTSGVMSSKFFRVPFSLSILLDNIALESPFRVPVNATVDGSSDFVIPFTFNILDGDVVTVGFWKSQYKVKEGAPPPNQYPKIELAKDKDIAQPLPVQVVPMRVDQFKLLNIPLPDGVTYADLPNPAQYNPNGLQDFDPTAQNVTFSTMPNDDERYPLIAIVEDHINEADQQFICVARLLDPALAGGVIFYPQSTVITIVDNDPISIGFEMALYTFTEGVPPGYYPDTIRLVKDDGVVSEQTFMIQVTALPADDSAVDNPAIYGVDYDIGPAPVQTFIMTPDKQYLPILINIYDDGAVHGTEQAILVSALARRSPIYSAPHNPTTTVIILNNHVAIVGFVTDKVTVTEGKEFLECVRVSSPSPDIGMQLNFYLMVNFIPLTAEYGDTSVNSTIIGPFDTKNRAYCFNVTASPDSYFDGNKTFKYLLTLASDPQPLVVISPNTTEVTIMDNNTLIIGFDQANCTVNESKSYVTFNVSILGDVPIQRINVGVMFSTEDGTAHAGQDYSQTNQLLIFNETVQNVPVTVQIINDGYFKEPKYFIGRLSLQFPSDYQKFIHITPSRTTALIVDDVASFSFVTANVSVMRSNKEVIVCLNKMGVASEIIPVKIITTPLRPGIGVSFSPSSLTINFLADESVLCALFLIMDDYVAFIGNKTFIFTFTIPSKYQKRLNHTMAVTIYDNSVVYLLRTEAISVVKENQNEVTVCFVAVPAAAIPVDVTVVATEDDVPNARSPQNFIANSLRLTIPPNTPPQSGQCVAFTIVDNKVALEPNKTFSIKVLRPPNVILVRPPGHVLIVDDDAVSVRFISSNYTSLESGSTKVCVSKDAMTATNISVEITLTSVGSCAYGNITPVIYTTVLVAGPVGAAACVNVTNDLWVGRSAFQVTITKVISVRGIAKVGVPSRASVIIYNAGCAVNEDNNMCPIVYKSGLCQLSVYNQFCCRTCGNTC